MEFTHLIEILGDEQVFETGLLLAGDVDPADVRRQSPFQKVKPHPFVIANRMVRGSYVSLQAALASYGLIPDVVPTVTSVTTAGLAGGRRRLAPMRFATSRPSCSSAIDALR